MFFTILTDLIFCQVLILFNYECLWHFITSLIRYAFHTVGIALFVTTLVLIAGFMVLTQSAFKLNADMGLLTAITIGIALLVDFIFLPPLLMKVDRQRTAAVAESAS